MHRQELVVSGNIGIEHQPIDEHARRMREANADAAMDPREAAPFIEEQSKRLALDGLHLTVRRPRTGTTGERHYFA